jgi:hypothetical protein
MEKQLAWAAAMSSSGFAPGVPSKRVLKLYGVPLIAPLATANVPLPSLRLPSYFAFALRFMIRPPFFLAFAVAQWTWRERATTPSRVDCVVNAIHE